MREIICYAVIWCGVNARIEEMVWIVMIEWVVRKSLKVERKRNIDAASPCKTTMT